MSEYPIVEDFGYGTRFGIFLAVFLSEKFVSIAAKCLGIAVFTDSSVDPFNDNSALFVCVDDKLYVASGQPQT